jgi:hypothetical protein
MFWHSLSKSFQVIKNRMPTFLCIKTVFEILIRVLLMNLTIKWWDKVLHRLELKMAHRFHFKTTAGETARTFLKVVPWRMYMVSILLSALAFPTFVYGIRLGSNIFSDTTHFFYELSAPSVASPTPPPPLPSIMPQVGSVLSTVEEGDSCDAMLAYRMRLSRAGEVFSDVKPETVQALGAAIGQDCHRLQPGMVLMLSPHYPLVALGGTVTQITSLTPHQAIPTPLIRIRNAEEKGPDCSGGCALSVQIAPNVRVRLEVKTSLTVRNGAWIWTLAMMARKNVPGFSTYPYVDSRATLNGMTLRACDFQVNDVHDDNSLACSQIQPNTITSDGGAWMFAVTGPGALDHWHFPLHYPPNTRLLLWLSDESGKLVYHAGDPLYRYDDSAHIYQKIH